MNDFQFTYDDLVPINYFGENKELTSDLEEIYQNTQNIVIDWQIRENSIRKIGQICVGDAKKSDIFLKFFNFEIISNLALQLADLRSSVMKEACRIVSLCGKELGNLAEPGAVHLLSRIILFKIAGSANRVIADSSSKCILNLVRHVNSIKIINNICEQKNQKSNFVRTICSQCILLIVSCYKKNLLLNKVSILQDTIKNLLSDPNGDVRAIIRKAFITFKKRLPGEAENVYKLLEKNVQKQINEDEKKYGNKIIINEENINKNSIELSPIKKRIKLIYSSENKSKSHEIKYNLKEIPGIKTVNHNNYNRSTINDNLNNFINEDDNNLNNNDNLNEEQNNILNFGKLYLNKMPIYKSAKGKKHANIFNIQNSNSNSNTIRINHKDFLQNLNGKYVNNNASRNTNDIKNENILPPINQFKISVNQSQKITKSSKSVIQNNRISINKDKENKNKFSNNNHLSNNYIPIIKKDISNIKIIKNNNSIETNVINNINDFSILKDANEKTQAFLYFFLNFKDILNEYKHFSDNTLRQFINIHLEHLNDNDMSLIEQIIKNLIKIIFYMVQILNSSDIQLIVKLIIKKINIGEMSISNLCYKLLDLIRKRGKIEDIYNGIFNSVEEKNIKNNDICYEYLAYLINRYGIIFGNNSYYERAFQLIYNADNNSKKIGKLIDTLYKNNPENFVCLFKEENKNNQEKIISIVENKNLKFIQELKNIDINKISTDNNFDKSINNKIRKIISESKTNTVKRINTITFEDIKINFENGNVKLFLSYLENNINFLPEFINILTTEKYSEYKYNKNYVNFIYALLSHQNNNFINKICQNLNILIEQIISILLSNKSDSLLTNSIKEILYILPIKINTEIYFKEISKYLNNKSDILLLQILLGSLKNYIVYDKNKNLEKNISFFFDGLLNLLEHNLSEIRKPAIFCCVEMYNILKDKFMIYFEKIPKNSQNIINQLIKKKYESGK